MREYYMVAERWSVTEIRDVLDKCETSDVPVRGSLSIVWKVAVDWDDLLLKRLSRGELRERYIYDFMAYLGFRHRSQQFKDYVARTWANGSHNKPVLSPIVPKYPTLIYSSHRYKVVSTLNDKEPTYNKGRYFVDHGHYSSERLLFYTLLRIDVRNTQVGFHCRPVPSSLAVAL